MAWVGAAVIAGEVDHFVVKELLAAAVCICIVIVLVGNIAAPYAPVA